MYITVALRGHNVSGSQLLYTNPQVGVGGGVGAAVVHAGQALCSASQAGALMHIKLAKFSELVRAATHMWPPLPCCLLSRLVPTRGYRAPQGILPWT